VEFAEGGRRYGGGRCRTVKEGKVKGERGLLEKRRGTKASLYLARARLADEGGSDAMPDAAGGEGGHGVARPEHVIHRYVFNQKVRAAKTAGRRTSAKRQASCRIGWAK
jgi:hypothetical protein